MDKKTKNILICHECGKKMNNKNNIDSSDVNYAAHKKCIKNKEKRA